MDELKTLLADESFQRWLDNSAEAHEALRWQQWLNAKPSHYELYQDAIEIWNSARFKSSDPPNIDAEWTTLHKRLKLQREPRPAKSTSRQHIRMRGKRNRFGAMLQFGFVACVVVLLVWLIQNRNGQKQSARYQKVMTEFGQRATIKLPDDSEIILNANSILEYPAHWPPARSSTIELQGEAFFKIAPQTGGNRFVVHTADGAVEVVGTRFAVYERGKGTRIAVQEGEVAVAAFDTSGFAPDSLANASLRRGYLLNFKRGERKLSPRKVNVDPYVTWWQNHFMLYETPFAEIVQRLEETYGIQVRVTDEKLLQKTLSGSIENRNLKVVTEALAKALRVKVSQKESLIIFEKSTN